MITFSSWGHSLLAIQLVSAIRQSLGVEVPIKTIFTYPTIGELAGQLVPNESSVMLLPILPGKRTGKLPLSFSQERLWFIDQLQGSTHYHLPAVFRLVGELDVQALCQSFERLVERHEVLRTVIGQVDGQAYQQILPADWRLDYRADTSLADEEDLKRLVQSIIGQPFDLSGDSMLRAVLMRLSDEE